jgi:hypothetical protein
MAATFPDRTGTREIEERKARSGQMNNRTSLLPQSQDDPESDNQANDK